MALWWRLVAETAVRGGHGGGRSELAALETV